MPDQGERIRFEDGATVTRLAGQRQLLTGDLSSPIHRPP